MEASMKYTLNPLAACFVPLSMKARTGSVNRDLNSEFEKCIPVYKHKHEAPSANKTKTDHSEVKNLDLICKQTTAEDSCYISENTKLNESVYTKATFEKLIDDEASKDRSKDRTSIEKMDLKEQNDATGNCLMELERTSNMADEISDPSETEETERTSNMAEISDPFETERTSNMADEISDPFETERTPNMNDITKSNEMNWTSNTARENTYSEIVKIGIAYPTMDQGKNLDYENMKSEQHTSTSSTESVHSTKSYQSDYGTDVESMEDCSDLPTEMLSNVKPQAIVESDQESTSELGSDASETELNLQMKSRNTVSLRMAVLLNSNLPSRKAEGKTYSKILKAGFKLKEECICPPMFGWIMPYDYLGNPLNLTGTCKKNYAHTSYGHSFYEKSYIRNNCRTSLASENYSIDSGHYSDDEPLSSVDEVNTLEQCSLELESIIKDVFDCVDQSLSSLEDEKPQTKDSKKSQVWLKANEKEVFRVQDSSIVDDGYHPLLQDTTSDDVDKEISIIEKFLGEAFAFGDKNVDEGYSSRSSCIPPCSVWCTNVPPPAIDMFKRFVKKIESEPDNWNVADDKKVFRKRIYKRCFSANDTPKDFDYDAVLSLASSWEPKAQFNQQDLIAFTDSKGTTDCNSKNVSSSFKSGQSAYPLKERSDTWSLYDGADSLWQPLPDCVLSTDHSQKYAYRRARLMKRQKSVG